MHYIYTSSKKRTSTSKLFLIAASLLAGMLIASQVVFPMSTTANKGLPTITGLVVASDDFEVLEAAVISAGFDELLNGKRSFTVFAPTDDAFISTLNTLPNVNVANEAEAIAAVEDLPLETLQGILKYHVMSGRHNSTSVLARDKYRTLNGFLSKTELVNAGIAQTDVKASNGTVHIINGVLGL